MKKIKTDILFPVLVILILSCSVAPGSMVDIPREEATIKFNNQVGNRNEDAVDYQADWEAFKVAIGTKNEAALKMRCTEKIKDYQGLLFMCTEIFVREKLDQTSFDELESVEINETVYLKFYTEDIGIDEFGYEYASTLTLYFLKTEEGLFLDNYSAAG